MAQGRDVKELTEYTGYSFRDDSLLKTAMTHSSYTNECRQSSFLSCNERLEFLGDAVLQIIVSDYLFKEFSTFSEGILTKFRQHLVCEPALASLAKKLHLGEFLILGKGEEQNGGRTHPSLLADAFEALLAAIYLDCDHKTDFLKPFLLHLMQDEISVCEKNRGGDYKTRLQQLVQQDGREQLSYEVIRESGPDHEKIFEVCAKINSNVVGTGIGHSKREAEQAAARMALSYFGTDEIN